MVTVTRQDVPLVKKAPESASSRKEIRSGRFGVRHSPATLDCFLDARWGFLQVF
jgi:hypothetical protein